EQFAEAVGEAGRYRLEAFDASGQNISGCVAVTEVAFDEEEPAATPMASPDALPHLIPPVGKLVEAKARGMEAEAAAFGQVRPATGSPTVVVERPAEPKSEDNPFVANVVQSFLQQFMAQKLGGFAVPPPASASNGGQS